MKNKIPRKIYPIWLCIPSIFIYTIFFIAPIIIAFVFSFSNWNLNKINSPEFIGLRNFINLFSEKIFLRSLGNTLLFALCTTTLKTVFGLILALVVIQKFVGNSIFRTLFYLPCVLSCMIVGLLFTGILRYDGLINNILIFLELKSLIRDWLGTYVSAMFWVVFIETWMWAGFNMFLFISGLNAIEKGLYESAQIDGASARQRFWKITLPMLAPSFTVVITLNMTGGLKVFDLIYALTGGGPGFDTQVLSTYTYRAFGLGLLGKASASSMILSVIIVIIAFSLNKTLRSNELDTWKEGSKKEVVFPH